MSDLVVWAGGQPLPDTVAADSIDAELKDGVLRVTLAKKKEAQPRTIDVKVS